MPLLEVQEGSVRSSRVLTHQKKSDLDGSYPRALANDAHYPRGSGKVMNAREAVLGGVGRAGRVHLAQREERPQLAPEERVAGPGRVRERLLQPLEDLAAADDVVVAAGVPERDVDQEAGTRGAGPLAVGVGEGEQVLIRGVVDAGYVPAPSHGLAKTSREGRVRGLPEQDRGVGDVEVEEPRTVVERDGLLPANASDFPSILPRGSWSAGRRWTAGRSLCRAKPLVLGDQIIQVSLTMSTVCLGDLDLVTGDAEVCLDRGRAVHDHTLPGENSPTAG